MSLQIPTEAVPVQALTVNLGGQACQIIIRQLSTGMYLDLYVNDSLIIGGVICQDRNRIVRDDYLGFIGDLCFLDSVGTDDPIYTGLGDRFNLIYLEADEALPAGVQ